MSDLNMPGEPDGIQGDDTEPPTLDDEQDPGVDDAGDGDTGPGLGRTPMPPD